MASVPILHLDRGSCYCRQSWTGKVGEFCTACLELEDVLKERWIVFSAIVLFCIVSGDVLNSVRCFCRLGV